ncbi:hypothetical protein ACEPAF_8265 [Sanghuangporus sanghuang]
MSVAVQAMVGAAPAPAIPNRGSPSPSAVERSQLIDISSKPSFSRRPLPPVPGVTRNSSVMSSSPLSRPVRASFISSARSMGLATICSNMRVLSCLLRFLTWSDFHSLSGTSRGIRRLFLDANVKETVFARFIPGYRIALKERDRRLWEDNIRMTYADLGLLIAALDLPLHRYPMQALSVLSSDLPTWEQINTTKLFRSYSLGHSRAVLLLQNLVYSSTRPVPSDLDAPLLRPSGSPSQTGLRELTFPAPLAYADLDMTNGSSSSSKSRPPSDSGDTAARSSSFSSKMVVPKSLKRHSKKWGPENGSLESDLRKSKRDRSTSRISIFGGQRPPPLPQPSTEPDALRYYSGSWRRSYYVPPPSDDGVLKPPKRRFVTSRYSSNSSLGSSPSPSSSRLAATPNNASSPHDLYSATTRSRAPILRVFVPCAEFTDEVITACEDQLIDDGLWEHMSVGDVVCNFGYVPLAEEPEENGQEKDHRRWLVFTGAQLEIYRPTQPPPITGALSLPSPLYYTHILPPFINPRLRLILPSFRAHYSLAPLATRVTSPQTPGGYARVKTFAWLASFDVYPSPGSLVSSGWAGEWVLQGEGTPEGKIALQDALRGGQETEHEYEVMLENCGAGKLWLRSVPRLIFFSSWRVALLTIVIFFPG